MEAHIADHKLVMSTAQSNVQRQRQRIGENGSSANTPQDHAPSAPVAATGTTLEEHNSTSSTHSRQSCTACRARKIKCNKTLPTCAQCQRAGATCFYAKSQRRGRPRNGTTPMQPISKEAQLEKRVKQLEAVIASIRGTGDTITPLEHTVCWSRRLWYVSCM